MSSTLDVLVELEGFVACAVTVGLGSAVGTVGGGVTDLGTVAAVETEGGGVVLEVIFVVGFCAGAAVAIVADVAGRDSF